MCAMRIEQFIAARLAADQQAAPDSPDPARALREVRAWRAMVRTVFEYEGELDHLGGAVPEDERSNVDHLPALRAIAAVWSDHPDYLPEWSSNPL